MKKNKLFPKLYHPGRLFHIDIAEKDGKEIYSLKKVDVLFYTDFSGWKHFPYDHMLNRFYNAFDFFVSQF